MNAQRWKEIQASVDSLVELGATERVGRLTLLASRDPELCQEVERLLAANAQASAQLACIDVAFLSPPNPRADPLGLAGRTISHFEVGEPLGAGGMGVVYRAQDTRLARPVALKFLLPAYSLDAVAKARFVREAHSAAALDHPNLCTMHEVGTSDDGWLFMAMALYEGETLRARLTRDGALPVPESLEIARQIAEGLRAAHAVGIVHRDLKPGNIMLLADGSVRILDFGLAKARDQNLTATGEIIGTVSYMAPEQIRGNGIDGRADLWALGVVLYEMLTNRTPFGSEHTVAIAHAILNDQPVAPSTHRRDLSVVVEEIVLRLLAKNRDKRYASAADLLENLARMTPGLGARDSVRRQLRRVRHALSRNRARFLAVGIAAIMLAALGLFRSIATVTGAPSAAADSTRSVAVLPFANVGGDSSNLPFSDGFADELTTALGKIRRLSVMARTSAFSLKRKGLDAREIGRQLHVQYIVDGSVRTVADRRRVTANLIDVGSGKEVWSANFEHDALNRDVFTVQDSITRSIVRQLLPHLSLVAVAASVKRPTENREAHDLYLQGRYFFEKKDSASFTKAKEYFQRAIRSDSAYALAYAGLSDAYSQQAVFGFAMLRTSFLEAKHYASRALALDSTLVEVHTSLAFIALFYEWDWVTAGREFDTALRLNERYAPAHLFHAHYFVARDSLSAAIAEGRRAVDLDPFSALNNTRLVTFLYLGGQYAEALEQGRKTFERDSNYAGLRQGLAEVYVRLGRCAEALAVLEHSVDQPVGVRRGIRGFTYAKCDRRARALTELDRLRQEARDGKYVSHYSLAVVQAGLGDNEEAIAELEKAYTEHVWSMFIIKWEPAFIALRSDPRFTRLVRKMGLGI